MYKVLLTGGAGYIGSVLSEMLIKKGYEVTLLDNFYYNQNSINHLCFFDNLKVINGDIRDKDLIKELIPKHDFIIPLAALVGAPLCDKKPLESQSINYDANKFIFECLNSDNKIIMPTTNSAYGSGDENNFCDEDSPLKPLSLYAKQKVELEKELIKKNNFISLRLATVFGMSPRMRLDLLVNDFVYRACKDRFIVIFEPNFKRNYIHLRDVCRAFIKCIDDFDSMKNNIYNVGLSSANISKLELCKLINKYHNFSIKIDDFHEDPDKRNYIVSNQKIEKTGFMPEVDLEEGIKELIKGYRFINNNIFKNI